MKILFCIFAILLFIVFTYLFIYDYIKLLKMRREEELRRETIKNAICDIHDCLTSISLALWYEK